MNIINDNGFNVRGTGESLESSLLGGVGKDKQAEVPFKDMLKGLVDKVDSLQKDADASIKGLVTGETTNLHDVKIKMEEAGVAFDLMMEIRNKLLDAYQQVMKMQS
ncbi:MAG: flagellar hook-basal body complex protein FliE [Lentisphaerae bacterium RIFOXYA12_FULL_48_11]|nr:MAG: flagellar hook-basal body complex protein FliE [Lentisphaerae bacterium RIFOXYA12_FULL_48_11]